MRRLINPRVPCTALLVCVALAVPLPAQTFTTLLSFNGFNGSSPEYGPLLQGQDGNLYGTTFEGGPNQGGTIFKVTLLGAITTLDSFNLIPSATPELLNAGLIQGSDGNFYGTSQAGGTSHNGTVFRVTPSGALTVLHNFSMSDGYIPYAGLVQGKDGNFYGTTQGGGVGQGSGTIFKITPGGLLTTVYSFNGTDGDYPVAVPIQATDGNFYGTTQYGGTAKCGTIFKITPAGVLTVLHNFSNTPDGAFPLSGLIQGTDGVTMEPRLRAAPTIMARSSSSVQPVH